MPDGYFENWVIQARWLLAHCVRSYVGHGRQLQAAADWIRPLPCFALHSQYAALFTYSERSQAPKRPRSAEATLTSMKQTNQKDC